jgi:hypothetical protein
MRCVINYGNDRTVLNRIKLFAVVGNLSVHKHRRTFYNLYMQAQSRALVNPQADFWLLGGLSIITVILAISFVNWDGRDMMVRVYNLSYYVALVVNYPHFAFSYQVFYKGLGQRLRHPETSTPSRIRMIVAGFVVPAVLLAYFVAAVIFRSMGMLSVGVNAMTLAGGWHYSRQGYGALITSSIYRNIFFSPRQKLILNANAYLIPVYAWVRVNAMQGGNVFYDVPYQTLGFPQGLANFFLGLVIINGLLALAVFLRLWLIDRRGIPINGVIGYICASYFWVLMVGISPFLMYMAPAFHSLQYLPFIYKYKKGESGIASAFGENTEGKRKALRSLIFFAAVGVILGYLFLDGLPKLFDYTLMRYGHPAPGFSHSFFMVSFLMFVSFHHYFIDYAFWRRDNKEVQRYVFRA